MPPKRLITQKQADGLIELKKFRGLGKTKDNLTRLELDELTVLIAKKLKLI